MFEKLEEKLTKLRNSVKSGASNFTENISLNSKIDDAKKSIATMYGEIGEKFYTENKDAAPAGYEESFAKIKESFAAIDSYAEQIKKISGIRTCPNCGADVAKDYRFCIACGTKMPEEEKPANDGKLVCEKCGAEAEEGALFCINCGAKINPVKEKKPENLCVRCGAKLLDGALFCTTCGQKVEPPAEEPLVDAVPEEVIPDENEGEAVAEAAEEVKEAAEEAAEAVTETVTEAVEEVKEAAEEAVEKAEETVE